MSMPQSARPSGVHIRNAHKPLLPLTPLQYGCPAVSHSRLALSQSIGARNLVSIRVMHFLRLAGIYAAAVCSS